MNISEVAKLVIIPERDLEEIKKNQEQILNLVKMQKTETKLVSPYITAVEFMEAVRIKRSKFDHLLETNKIKSIKKGRKIYVPASEVERYFSDESIK